jgi:hypothetical protein
VRVDCALKFDLTPVGENAWTVTKRSASAVERLRVVPHFVGSVVGSLGYAGYEYANSGAAPGTSPQQQPSAQLTLSLNDVE